MAGREPPSQPFFYSLSLFCIAKKEISMENLVVEHKEALKNGIVNLLVTVVLAAVLIVAADQFVMSVGTAILIAALVFVFLKHHILSSYTICLSILIV